MKLPDLKKTRLSTVSTYGVVSILGTAMVIIAIVAIAAIRGAGSYSLKTTKTAIKTEAVKLLQKNTKRKAEEYSEIFKNTLMLAELLNDNINLALKVKNRYKIPDDMINKFTSKYLSSNENMPLVRIDKEYNLWSVYGNNNIEADKMELYILSNFSELLNVVCNISKYYYSTWVCLYSINNLNTCFRNKNYNPDINKTKLFNQLLGSAFDKYMQNKDRKLFFTNLFRDVYGILMISAEKITFSTYLNVGIDVSFLDLTNNILKHKVPFIVETNKKNLSCTNTYIVGSLKGEILGINKEFASIIKLPQDKFDEFQRMENFDLFLQTSKLKSIKTLAKQMKKEESGLSYFNIDGKEYISCFYRMSIKDWTLCVSVSVEDLYKAVEETEARMGVTVMGFIINFVMVAIFFMFILLIVVILFFKTYLVKPIVSFRDNVLKMGEGDLETPIKEKGVYEISVLANSFNSLRVDLKSHMDDFKVEISHKQRRENELKTARQVQLSVLPKLTSLFQNRGIELYAKLLPAIDVAGDYYDFFYVGVNKLILIIADVSGKGISASFFMAVTKRTLRNTCINEPDDPAKSIDMANKILCGYNINMFVTLFLIYYDMETGEIKYANGGHNEAVCLKENGTVDVFGCLNNAALGCFPDLHLVKLNTNCKKEILYIFILTELWRLIKEMKTSTVWIGLQIC